MEFNLKAFDRAVQELSIGVFTYLILLKIANLRLLE